MSDGELDAAKASIVHHPSSPRQTRDLARLQRLEVQRRSIRETKMKSGADLDASLR